MSESEKLSKSQLKRRRNAEKRKASGSPGQINGGHYVYDSSKSPSGTVSNFLMNSQDFVHSVMQSPAINMNGQFTPVMQGMHSIQSPQNVFPIQSPSTPPGWALSLIEDVKQIKGALPKIDEIEQTVKSIQRKMTDLELKVTNLEAKSTEAEKSLTFMSNEYENQKTALNHSKKQIDKLEAMCTKLKTSISEQEKEDSKMQDKLLDLESRSMRENLIFYGLGESEISSPGELPEPSNCEALVRELIKDTLEIDHTEMVFDRVHRLGGIRAKKPRPIVVKFQNYTDREKVRIKSYDDDTKQKLKGKKQGVGIQAPKAYRDARKAFSDYIKSEQIDENNTRIVGTKLYINNKISKKFSGGKIVDYVES